MEQQARVLICCGQVSSHPSQLLILHKCTFVSDLDFELGFGRGELGVSVQTFCQNSIHFYHVGPGSICRFAGRKEGIDHWACVERVCGEVVHLWKNSSPVINKHLTVELKRRMRGSDSMKK